MRSIYPLFFGLPGFTKGLRGMAIMALALIAGVQALAQTPVPAQQPLLARFAGARPNILLVMDNSTSMLFECVYRAHVVTAANDPDLGATGCLPATGFGDGDARQNSAANNALWYDPSVTYRPGFNAAALRAAPAPLIASRSVFIHIPKPGFNPVTASAAAQKSTSNYNLLEIDPGNFRYNGTAVGTTNPLLKPASRVDCVADATRCTLAEERQNYANWSSFYRTRLAAAQTGIGEAFFNQPDTFRMAFSRLDQAATGFRNFADFRAELYLHLYTFMPSNGTPLRTALNNAGQYYERTDSRGPWATTPWQDTAEQPRQHDACRRSYTLLMTDGYWNDDTAALPGMLQSNVDNGLAFPAINHATKPQSYTYRASDSTGTNPLSRGKADAHSGTLADVALYYWARDLRGTPGTDLPNIASDRGVFWQNMTTYTIGFGVNGSLTPAQIDQAKAGQAAWPAPVKDTRTTIDDMIHAAHNGGGEFLAALDSTALANGINRIVNDIADRAVSEAGVAATGVVLTPAGVTHKFVPYYHTGGWWGNLSMVALNGSGGATGTTWKVVDEDADGNPTGTSRIPQHDQRNIWVWANSTRGAVPFTEANIVAEGLRAGSAAANADNLLHHTANAGVVNYLRGDRAGENTNPRTYRARKAVLGSIVNSTPVFIKNSGADDYSKMPAHYYGAGEYAAYRAAKAARTEGVLFVGANDGMLHGFREGSAGNAGGTEVFAFMPRGVLGKVNQLSNLNYTHNFYVDGPLVEADAYIGHPRNAAEPKRWRNVLLGSAGLGAKTVFALDVTSPLNMTGQNVMWEISSATPGFEDLGHVTSPIQVAYLLHAHEWVAIFNNGVHSSTGKSVLYVVKLVDGALLHRFDMGSGGSVVAGDESTYNGLGGVRLVRNAELEVIGAYAGDLKGRVWKFDMATLGAWKVANNETPLFVAKDPSGVVQPITAQPAVQTRLDTGTLTYMVTVGTGRLFTNSDVSSSQIQSVYGLWDLVRFGQPTLSNPIAQNQLQVVTSVPAGGGSSLFSVTTTATLTGNRGWQLELRALAGQRVIYSIENLNALVRVDTVAPQGNTLADCTVSAAAGVNYLISAVAGTCQAGRTLDTNADRKIDALDSVACAYSTLADGEDVVLGIAGFANVADIQSSSDHRMACVKDCACPAGYLCCSGPACQPEQCNDANECCQGAACNPPKSSTRHWRQLFLRGN